MSAKTKAAPGHEKNKGAGPESRLLRLKEPLGCGRSTRCDKTALTMIMNINKLRRSILLTVLAASAAVFGACTTTPEVKPSVPASPSPAVSSSPAVSPAASPSGSVAVGGEKGKIDALVGKWPGAEGTHLNIAKKGEKYSIEIANLDGPKTYEGTAKGDAIEFTRNGKTETIRTASGVETGMKDFAKETNCIVIAKGEGYCRK